MPAVEVVDNMELLVAQVVQVAVVLELVLPMGWLVLIILVVVVVVVDTSIPAQMVHT